MSLYRESQNYQCLCDVILIIWDQKVYRVHVY